METLAKWIEDTLPLLLEKKVDKIEGAVIEGKISAYWAGSVLRIDIKPRTL
jgi:hypothetical protein